MGIDNSKLNLEVSRIQEINQSVSLKYLDIKDFGFKKMNSTDLKNFDKFITQIQKYGYEGISFEKCKDDKTDILNGQQIHHFKLSKKFRIHGFMLNGRFKVVRIDPKHEFH